ncbi:head-tail adaptor protein [Mesoaciditoga lauensis]|uniref:head-tail adaptor protein n=1 Tax=Mesoaciditoga lauensis TaxID=1495039 RepID=UPI0005630487|nr:head-tail adaptor protein [Mesoaciditoga lauensis]
MNPGVFERQNLNLEWLKKQTTKDEFGHEQATYISNGFVHAIVVDRAYSAFDNNGNLIQDTEKRIFVSHDKNIQKGDRLENFEVVAVLDKGVYKELRCRDL